MTNTELREFVGTDREIEIFLLAVLLGACFGVIYDLFRGLRAGIKQENAAVFFEDMIFSFSFVFGYFSFCTEMLGGSLRFYVLAAQLLGFFVYLLTLGRVISGIVTVLIETVVKILKKTAHCLFRVPFFKKIGRKF